MKPILAILLIVPIVFCENAKVIVAGDTVFFSEKLDESAKKKRILLKDDSLQSSPFDRSLAYDSSSLKVFEIKEPATAKDTIEFKDRGILSNQWGVKTLQGNRYLNITDLKKLGVRSVDAEVIHRWIIGGKLVKSNARFKQFTEELRNAKIISTSLPKGFSVSDTVTVEGFRKVSATFLLKKKFIKFSYLVSSKNEVMLLKKELIVDVYAPRVVAHPGMPSYLTLKNPKDSAAFEASGRYSDVIQKYSYELFN